MSSNFWKRAIITILILFVLAGIGLLAYIISKKSEPVILPPVKVTNVGLRSVIGLSVQGREIEAYTYGSGPKQFVFVGGIHGGYEWNSVLLAYKLKDYLLTNPSLVPANLTVTVIPDANPDGVYLVTGKTGPFTVADVKENLPSGTGRFNADKVDLNRNFDCDWQATSTWKGNIVSAGTAAFSEPEAKAIRDFVLKNKPAVMVFLHSQSNAVYASQCGKGILPETRNIMNLYAKAAGYPAVDVFDSYAVTGAVEDWLSSINIPAITVELKTHETIEWDKNLAGIKALLDYGGKEEVSI